ncbi:OLC1v1013973C8 [Oldenlandia corymbosa var. corymbosa]|uniref:OLC1v1013973C8 n=1 Tax=Oldenlandia corymbosa var. corymbosa TaxID=529605 RepID=A0AAV1DZZ2_OLDCO|nr:OLC1v1013973C8 [Oldenlandia corymbosa var. corymbosa]
MDFWQKARNLAEEAAKRSQELTNGITVPTKLSDVVSEASKRSIEIATEASRKSKEIAAEALKRADQIKSQLPPAAVAFSSLVDNNSPPAAPEVSEADLEKFGVTDDLREFVKEITLNTFRDFPLEDVSEVSDVPAVSNVRQDLTEWQEKHAKLVLATVKVRSNVHVFPDLIYQPHIGLLLFLWCCFCHCWYEEKLQIRTISSSAKVKLSSSHPLSTG